MRNNNNVTKDITIHKESVYPFSCCKHHVDRGVTKLSNNVGMGRCKKATSERTPSSTEGGQGTDKEVEHFFLSRCSSVARGSQTLE